MATKTENTVANATNSPEVETFELKTFVGGVTPTSKIRAYLDEAIETFNAAVDDEDISLIKKLSDNIGDALKSYAVSAKSECYKGLLTTEDPMAEACKALTYSTLASKLDEAGYMVLGDKSRYINLEELNKKAKDFIGKDKGWLRDMYSLNALFIARAVSELEPNTDIKKALAGISDSVVMARIGNKLSEEISLKGYNASQSNTFMLKQLTTLVSKMIGEEFKPTSHDVRALSMTFCKMGKKEMTVECGNLKNFDLAIMMICHGLLEKKFWKTVYKTVK